MTLSKADFAIQPVSPRYGARVIEDGGKRVGYLNLRTFIDPADPALRQAVGNFRTQGITEVIVDFRPGAGVRVSPHFYTTDEEVERTVAEIADIVETGAWKAHVSGSGAAY